MIQVFLWALTIASITATILNIKKYRVAFPMWIFTDSTWALYNFSKGTYSASAMFTVYAILAVWGTFEWWDMR
jgi:nicotinamide riboside transporter PnuC